MNREKVVYVLGAGFSISAGGPSQAQILADILNLDPNQDDVGTRLTAFRNFLTKKLCLDLSKPEGLALEDIYTPIDRCIADGISLKNFTPDALKSLREDLGYLISKAISLRLAADDPTNSLRAEYIRDFANFVVKRAALRAVLARDTSDSTAAKDHDLLSIICLNWDILLDNALYCALQDCYPDPIGDYDPFGVVDYCCYISSLDAGERRIRSGLWSLGCRGYNIKLLKPHGSMNWLQCTNCQRLFVQFGNKQNILERIGKECCRHCKKSGYENRLAGSLVMPTFLKDLRNFQIKLVWQNTGIELMEARRLVFIGYSLPQADFEFRQLLSRMVHKDTTIDVVLYEGSTEPEKRKYQDEKDRYHHFFGNRKLTFHSDGAAAFLKTHIAEVENGIECDSI